MLCSFGTSTEASAPAVLSFSLLCYVTCTYTMYFGFIVQGKPIGLKKSIIEASLTLSKSLPKHTLQILLFDFYGEVYVWVGKRSPGPQRKKAIEMGRKVFDAGCRPPVFNIRSSPARASGRYRPRSSVRSSRNSVLNASGRRSSKVKSELAKRPGWAMFAR